MKKSIRVSEPSPEMQEKIRRARCAIVNQKMRMVKCPYCGHNAIAVFEDSRGHIQAKCTFTEGKEITNTIQYFIAVLWSR